MAPLSAEHNVSIDNALLGHWLMLPDETDPNASLDSMTVLQFSDTEYLVNYTSEGSVTVFRAYLIEVGKGTLLQLEFLGTDEGPPQGNTDEHRFMVAQYVLHQGELEVKTLNTDVVSRDLKDSQSLVQAYLANLDNPELFNNPGVFIKQ